MIEQAPGGPGTAPTWTSSAKDMVGCALGISRLWFTLGFGIVNEVYYPRVDIPQIRDLGFIIADGAGFWAEVKRIANYRLRLLAPGVPAVEVVHRHERYTLRLRIAPDARRDVLAIECRLDGDPRLKVYALLAPHLGATGYGNRAAIVFYRRRRTLWAEQGPFGAALVAVDQRQRDAIGRASAGYVGDSDGWQNFARNGAMTWEYENAGPGNVALMAELPRRSVLALGFGSSAEAAATLAISSLLQPFDNCCSSTLPHGRHGKQNAASALRCRSIFRPPSPTSFWYRRSCYAAISTKPIPVQWWRASASRGAIPAMNAAGITWCGRAIWSRPPAHYWRSAPSRKRAIPCATYVPPRTRTAIGTRTSGSEADPSGKGFSLTRPPFPCCSPRPSTNAKRSPASRSRTWCAGRSATSQARDQRPSRIAGRKALASIRSRWPRASPLWSPAPSCCRRAATGRSNSLISGTAMSSAGPRSRAR